MEARLTLSGLLAFDPTIFDNMVLPSPPIAADIGMQAEQVKAAWEIDKTTLINYLSMRTASQSLVYPDAVYMKNAVHTWSAMHLQTWQALFNTWFFKYNPIWNKDGVYSTTANDTRTAGGTSLATVTADGNGDNTHYVHGYDQNVVTTPPPLQWTNSDKDAATNHSVTTNDAEYDATDELEHLEDRTEQGNIGVTTTQQMIREERDNAMFNLYDVIADSFVKFFCIAIY